jgi:hypothetical protein
MNHENGAFDVLHSAREAALQQIAQAARTGDLDSIDKNSSVVRSIDAMLNRHQQLGREAASLAKDIEFGRIANHQHVERDHREREPGIESPRDYGESVRRKFVSDLAQEGVTLRRSRGALYATSTGVQVAIAFARERLRNRWFLGIPEDSCDQAILLCESDSGGLIVVVLDQEFFARYGRSLSRSKGQWKFNVYRSGASIFLGVPNHGSVAVDSSLNNFDSLREL